MITTDTDHISDIKYDNILFRPVAVAKVVAHELSTNPSMCYPAAQRSTRLSCPLCGKCCRYPRSRPSGKTAWRLWSPTWDTVIPFPRLHRIAYVDPLSTRERPSLPGGHPASSSACIGGDPWLQMGFACRYMESRVHCLYFTLFSCAHD